MRTSSLLSVLMGCAVVLGCGTELPPGANFLPEGNTTVLLNKQGEEWRLFVNGQDKTLEWGFKAQPSPAGSDILTSFERSSGVVTGVPLRFSLQQTLAATYECVECEPGHKSWNRR